MLALEWAVFNIYLKYDTGIVPNKLFVIVQTVVWVNEHTYYIYDKGTVPNQLFVKLLYGCMRITQDI